MMIKRMVATMALAVVLAAGPAFAQDATPSTNEINKANGWAHVNELDVGIWMTSLEFVSTRNFASCFEYRTDGNTDQRLRDPDTGEFLANFNTEITDGLYPFECENNSSSEHLLFATDFVEVRMVFGAEKDERFTWTRFDVAQGAVSKNQCKDDAWENFGFKNQGQCIRYIKTGFDSR